jgi:hypothetical protein
MSPKKRLAIKGLSPRKSIVVKSVIPGSIVPKTPPARTSAAKSPAKAPTSRATPMQPLAPRPKADDLHSAGIRFDFIREVMMDQSEEAALDTLNSELYALLNEHSNDIKAAYRWYD